MTTSEPATRPAPQPLAAPAWRDIAQATADGACVESFALEHLIDLQRGRTARRGEAR